MRFDNELSEAVELLGTAQDACFVPEAFAMVVLLGGYLFGNNDVGLAALFTLLSIIFLHGVCWFAAFCLWQFLPDEEVK